MASGYRNDVSQHMKEEIHAITKELQERVTFDDRNPIYASHSFEYKYTENTTLISYDHGERQIVEHRSNDVQTSHNSDTNIRYESHHQNFLSSFDRENSTVDSYQETSSNTSSNSQHEMFTYNDLLNDSEYESNNYIDLENNNTLSEIQYEASTFEDSVDNFVYIPTVHVDAEINTEIYGNLEDHISSYTDYEYSENSEDYYYDDNEYSDGAEDYYYEDSDD